MNTCERYETHLSAWLDDELERPEQFELLDHLMRCPACREFTIMARSLEGLAATVRPPRDAVRPSPGLWHDIQRAAADESISRPAPSAEWSAGWRVAAVLILAVGLGALLMADRPPVDTGYRYDPGVEIRLGENAGGMSDARFMELTTEVLRADPRYHAALYRVMEQVVRDTGVREASAEYFDSDEAADEPVVAEARSRNPA